MMQIISREDATAKGLKRFFTGRACCHGHLVERFACSGKCVECNRLLRRAFRLADPDREKARVAQYNKGKPPRKQKYRPTTDKDRERGRERWHRIKAKNAALLRERNQLWKLNNPEGVKAIRQRRRAKLRQAVGTHTADDIKWIYAKQRGKCAYCRVPLNMVFEVDHIQALSRGGSNYPNNLQVCCRPCNASKRARDPIEFAQSVGLLV